MSLSVRRALSCGVAAATAILSSLSPFAATAQPGLSGTLVITNKTPATATIIDVASGRILATLPTGHGPHEIVVSRDGRTAVVTDYGTGPQPGTTLTIIDVPTRRVTKTVSLGQYRRPHGIMLLPGDSIAAVTVEADKAVLLVRLATGEIAKTIMTNQNGSHMVGVTADGTRGWTGDIGSNTVSELDLVRGTSLALWPSPRSLKPSTSRPTARKCGWAAMPPVA